jgi:ABC-2 type transport system ATP-binding protein
MSIITHNITKVYGSQKALHDVSLTIKPGEIVGLLGPNGAGKSTLMKILTCFLPPTSGTASVMGFDVQEQSIEVRRLVGYLPESNALYTDMYIREFLAFVAGLHHLGSATASRIDEMIQLTGLEAEVHKKIRMLSKGYKQRVGIAQALIHNPQVLILDEPTSGLDPNQLIEIRNLIKNIGKDKTIILSTHIMQEVEALCNRVVIINKGEIVADDVPENISSAKTKDIIVVEFLQKVEAAALKKISGIKNVNQEGNSWLIEQKDGADVRQSLTKWAVENNLTIQSLKKKSLSMEESFQNLTRSS